MEDGWKPVYGVAGWCQCVECKINMLISAACITGCTKCGKKLKNPPPLASTQRQQQQYPGNNSTKNTTLLSGLLKAVGTTDPTQITEKLYLGSRFSAEDKDKLTSLGIRYILNVTTEAANLFTGLFQYYQIPIVDQEMENIMQYFPAAFEFIEKAMSEKSAILVHCVAGSSRSATIVIAYLMKYNNMSLKDAFVLCRKKRNIVSPNKGFMSQLIVFENQLYSTNTVTTLESFNNLKFLADKK